MDDLPDPAVLAEAIKDLNDDELATQIDGLGTEAVLGGIFQGMQAAFRPDKAGDTSCDIQYDIQVADKTQAWTVSIADGACTTQPGPADEPRLTLSLAVVDFVRLIFNQVEGPQLFMSGKLKLKGDMMFAMQMQSYFERDF